MQIHKAESILNYITGLVEAYLLYNQARDFRAFNKHLIKQTNRKGCEISSCWKLEACLTAKVTNSLHIQLVPCAALVHTISSRASPRCCSTCPLRLMSPWQTAVQRNVSQSSAPIYFTASERPSNKHGSTWASPPARYFQRALKFLWSCRLKIKAELGGGAVCGKQAWKRQSLQNTPEPRESCLWSTHQCFLNSEIWILIFSLWIKNSCTEYRIYSNILKIEKCILTQLHLFGSTSLNRYQVIAAFRASEARSDSAPEHIPSVCCKKHRADMT